MAQYIGQHFGDYRLVKHLGGGGFANVYLGEHIYLHAEENPKRAAIKILKGNFTVKEIADLRNEAQTISRLKHPHIVPLITFSVAKVNAQNIPFLVMDHAEYGSLDKYHPPGFRLPLTTIITYVKQIAEALEYAHARKVVHRDIKPANFLLGSNKEVLLSDFGIAVLAHRTNSREEQTLVGTWFYAAPEHFEAKAVTTSDQYSLGVVVYRWLSGVLPFSGNFAQLGYQHHYTPPPSLCEKVPTISPEVEQVVMKALAKNPDQRFASIQVFSDALERACQWQQSVTISSALEKEAVLKHQAERDFIFVTGKSQSIHVLVEIQPTELMTQVRMPLNFALVVDRSFTMKGAKLKNVKEALKAVIDRMKAKDRISVIIFDDDSQIIIPSTLVNDPVSLKAIIDRIDIRGASITNRFMSRGMTDGLNELRRWNRPNMISRMILLTDGITSGDADLCCQLARESASARIPIHPMGIGVDWDENLLDTIGMLSGGMPAEFIRNPADALNLFQEQIQSEIDVILRNVTLILHLSAGVMPKKAVKILPIIETLNLSVFSPRQITIPLGDLEKDEQHSVLFELMVDSRQAGRFCIAQAELNYGVPIISAFGGSISDDIEITFTEDASISEKVNTLVRSYAKNFM